MPMVSDAQTIAFRAKVKEAGEVLSDLDLIHHRNYWPSYDGMEKEVRKQHYRDEWAYYESKSLFDFQLVDGSLFQFKDRPEPHTDASFCFYDSPVAAVDYPTFLHQTFDVTVEEAGDEGRDDYEDYLSSADLKRAVTMIRYDHSPGLYREGCHPASHLHIGHGTQIRLGTRRVMNPISFTFFVLRQAYPLHWERLIAKSKADRMIKHVRTALSSVHPDYFKSRDGWELYLE